MAGEIARTVAQRYSDEACTSLAEFVDAELDRVSGSFLRSAFRRDNNRRSEY